MKPIVPMFTPSTGKLCCVAIFDVCRIVPSPPKQISMVRVADLCADVREADRARQLKIAVNVERQAHSGHAAALLQNFLRLQRRLKLLVPIWIWS